MADQKLSQLTAATLPLAGTELVYTVQGGAERRTTAAAIAALAAATNLSYDPATRLLSSSTGADVTLPLVSTTAAGLVPSGWLTGAEAATLPHIHGALAGVVYEHVRNVSGATMAAMTPYHVVGSQGDTDRVQIVPADSSDPQTMPASGILMTALANNEDGHGVIAGVPTGLNTVANPSGTTLYVGTGVLTATAPAANVQAIAVVGRSHASTGTLSMLPGPALARVAFTGAYADLGGRPTLGTAAAQDVGAFATPQQLTTGLAGKADLVNGLVPSAQLPGFVDDVLEFADFASLPATGEAGKLYITTNNNKQYRWSGTQYIELTSSPGSTDAVPEGSINLYFTSARAQTAAGTWWTGASTAAGRALVTAADAAAQRTSLGLGDSATRNVGTAADTVAAGDDNRFIALSSTAPSNLAATAAAGTGTQAARSDHIHQFQPTDIIIPLSSETQSLATGIAVTISRWPRDHVLTAIPLWMVNTASVGAALQLDIRVGGTSIFATLPTIDATEQGSDTAAVFAVFSTAFISAGQLIAQNSVVTFHVLQIGTTTAGAGLKVALPVRRAG